MDNNDNKTIDGIKPHETSINTDTNQADGGDGVVQEPAKQVEISSDGEIAQEPTVTQEESSSDDTNKEKLDESTNELNPKDEPDLMNSDPGIVPSTQPVVQAPSNSPQTEVAKLKERNRHLKIWLVLVVILLVAVASALVVYFSMQSKSQADLEAQKQQNASLQQELATQQQTANQQTIDDLNKQLQAEKDKNASLQATVDQQNKTIQSYQAAVKELLTLCGSKCSNVDVPEDTTQQSNNTNTN